MTQIATRRRMLTQEKHEWVCCSPLPLWAQLLWRCGRTMHVQMTAQTERWRRREVGSRKSKSSQSKDCSSCNKKPREGVIPKLKTYSYSPNHLKTNPAASHCTVFATCEHAGWRHGLLQPTRIPGINFVGKMWSPESSGYSLADLNTHSFRQSMISTLSAENVESMYHRSVIRLHQAHASKN